MKNLQPCFASVIILFIAIHITGCGESGHTQDQQFLLTIQRYDGETNLIYDLTDTSLTVTQIRYPAQTDSLICHIPISGNDSLLLVSKLDIKSRDCSEQHLLVCNTVSFSINNTLPRIVDPGVNHPKELDIAVRIINSYLSEKYRLFYLDEQRAIDEIEKLNV